MHFLKRDFSASGALKNGALVISIFEKPKKESTTPYAIFKQQKRGIQTEFFAVSFKKRVFLSNAAQPPKLILNFPFFASVNKLNFSHDFYKLFCQNDYFLRHCKQ